MAYNLNTQLSHSPHGLRQFVLCSSYGSRRSNSSRWIHHNAAQQSDQLGEAIKRMANAFCNSLLRHRTDGNSIEPLRSRKIWGRSISFQPSASRSHDRCRSCLRQDDASSSKNLSANDRAEVGYINGSMCINRRRVRYIRSCARSRSISSCRCVCSRMSTKARTIDRRRDGNPTINRRRQHPIRGRWITLANEAGACIASEEVRGYHNQYIVISDDNTHGDIIYGGSSQ